MSSYLFEIRENKYFERTGRIDEIEDMSYFLRFHDYPAYDKHPF